MMYQFIEFRSSVSVLREQQSLRQECDGQKYEVDARRRWVRTTASFNTGRTSVDNTGRRTTPYDDVDNTGQEEHTVHCNVLQQQQQQKSALDGRSKGKRNAIHFTFARRHQL